MQHESLQDYQHQPNINLVSSCVAKKTNSYLRVFVLQFL